MIKVTKYSKHCVQIIIGIIVGLSACSVAWGCNSSNGDLCGKIANIISARSNNFANLSEGALLTSGVSCGLLGPNDTGGKGYTIYVCENNYDDQDSATTAYEKLKAALNEAIPSNWTTWGDNTIESDGYEFYCAGVDGKHDFVELRLEIDPDEHNFIARVQFNGTDDTTSTNCEE